MFRRAAGGHTADLAPFTPAQRASWLAELLADERTPVFVFEAGGRVVGYAYLSPYRKGRAALRDVAEVSSYLDLAYRKRGIGSALLRRCIEAARALGYSQLIAILLGCNSASVAILLKFGFEKWGELPGVAKIGGERFSHLYYGLQL